MTAHSPSAADFCCCLVMGGGGVLPYSSLTVSSRLCEAGSRDEFKCSFERVISRGTERDAGPREVEVRGTSVGFCCVLRGGESGVLVFAPRA